MFFLCGRTPESDLPVMAACLIVISTISGECPMNRMSKEVAARVEELLREQLEDLGVDVAKLEPHVISENMRCDMYPDESMVYSWKETQLLRIVPEKDDDGSVLRWRMFTKDDTDPVVH
jgi:hypothetical protein